LDIVNATTKERLLGAVKVGEKNKSVRYIIATKPSIVYPYLSTRRRHLPLLADFGQEGSRGPLFGQIIPVGALSTVSAVDHGKVGRTQLLQRVKAANFAVLVGFAPSTASNTHSQQVFVCV
jgi:hypothetical protein